MAYIRPIAWDPGFTIDEMLPPEPLRRQELLCSQLQGAHRLRWGTHPPLKPSQRSNPGQKRIVRRDILENTHVWGLVKNSQDYFREQSGRLQHGSSGQFLCVEELLPQPQTLVHGAVRLPGVPGLEARPVELRALAFCFSLFLTFGEVSFY